MRTARTLLLATAIFVLSGCCMKSMEIKPQIDALNLKTAKAGSLSANINIDFKECCPSKEQEKIALTVQSKIADLYTKLLNDEISMEEYNAKINAATNAIENVVLVCSPRKKTMDKSMETMNKSISPGMSLDEAWNELEKVNQKL